MDNYFRFVQQLNIFEPNNVIGLFQSVYRCGYRLSVWSLIKTLNNGCNLCHFCYHPFFFIRHLIYERLSFSFVGVLYSCYRLWLLGSCVYYGLLLVFCTVLLCSLCLGESQSAVPFSVMSLLVFKLNFIFLSIRTHFLDCYLEAANSLSFISMFWRSSVGSSFLSN